MRALHLAIRALRASPITSSVAMLSLALGIGANTAIFSLINSMLLRSLPVRDPTHLALVGRADSGALRGGQSWTYPIWNEIRQKPELFAGSFAWSTNRFNLSSRGQTDPIDGIWASGGFFETLGVSALLGRTFGDADDQRSGGPDGPVVVISHGFWQRRFGGAGDVVGRTLTLDGVSFTVIGVTPPEFFGVDVGFGIDVFVPIGTEPLVRGEESALERRSVWWLRHHGQAQTRAVLCRGGGRTARYPVAGQAGHPAGRLAPGGTGPVLQRAIRAESSRDRAVGTSSPVPSSH